MAQALERPLPDGIAEQRTDLRVVSEIARAAVRSARPELLLRSARRFVRVLRLWPVRDPLLTGDESINPIALAGGQFLDAGDVGGLFALLDSAGASLSGVGRLLERLRRDVPIGDFVRACRGADAGRLAEFINRYYRDPSVALEVMRSGLASANAAYRIRYAAMLVKAGRRDEALAPAREAIESARDEDVRLSALLMTGRILIAAGERATASELLRPRASDPGPRASHVAEILDAAGSFEEALACYRMAAAAGERPHLQTARLLHRLGRLEEALSEYEADLKSGSRVAPWPPDEDLGPMPLPEGVPASSEEGRALVRRLLGR